MKDMFGYEIKEKPERRVAPPPTQCKWTFRDEIAGRSIQCEKGLVNERQIANGYCDRHQECINARKAKAAWYGRRT